MTEPKNALVKQYQKLMEFDNVKLSFSLDAMKLIASLALEKKMGARALRSIAEVLMLDFMFEEPSIKGEKKREIVINTEIVLSKFPQAKIIRKDAT